MLRSNRNEKILYIVSFLVLILSVAHLGWQFYESNSINVPAEGGTYTEGAVGTVNFLNPLLAQPNTVEADITNLIYSGLTKYDSITGSIIPDLATYTLDTTKKKYTFKINPKAKWHDNEKVTADDILFTYKDVLQNAAFSNDTLRATFQDIKIEKLDDLTVQFTLKEPYYFFPTATTIGILPKHIWGNIPVKDIDKSEFNLNNPIGSGPYKFMKFTQPTEKQLASIDLQVFPDFYGEKPKLAGISFKLSPSIDPLLSNLASLDAMNDIPKESIPTFSSENRFAQFSYTLPQYVALFLNMESPILEDKNVHLALLLATNKEDILKIVEDVKRVDTPFLEVKDSSWIYQADPEKAKGSLYDAGWKLKKLQQSFFPSLRYLTATEVPTSSYKITAPNNGQSFTTNENSFILRGTNPASAKALIVNNYTLKKFISEKGTWSFIVSTSLGTLKKGKNVYNAYYVNENNEKAFIDSITITYDPSYNRPAANTNVNATDFSTNTNENASVSNTNKNISSENKNVNISVENRNENANAITNSNGNVNNNANGNTNKNEALLPETQTGSVLPEKDDKDLIPANIQDLIRYNKKGEPLVLHLVTLDNPNFSKIAQYVKQEWLKIGIYVDIQLMTSEDIQKAIQEKLYDVILYGQSLEYNLDTFPYWHSSQTSAKGLNLSKLKNFEVDALLESIRNPYLNKTINVSVPAEVEQARKNDLKKLIQIFETTVPAIFLYQPTYHYAVDSKKIKNVSISNLNTFANRFSAVQSWYVLQNKILKQPFSWQWFWQWLWGNV